MHTTAVPRADLAIIGGSSTFSLNFPEDLADSYPHLKVKETGIVIQTPYGESPSFKRFTLGQKNFLTVKMHGWRDGVPRGRASQQIFWTLRRAGVSSIIAEGGVGAVNHLLKPRDLLIPSDYLDFSMRKDTGLDSGHLLIMREPVCPVLTGLLLSAAKRNRPGDTRIFDRGIYAVTDGRHFESRAEIDMLKRLGADIVGQSMCPEVYLAREIGACYTRLDMVVNYAEGVVEDWRHEELKEIFFGEAKQIAGILLDAVAGQDLIRPELHKKCNCSELRKKSLLQKPN